ncbi:MAG TPA: PilZ domain-containing protein [Gemmataceae bacterium]|jgi:hypothetical protein
MSGSADRRAQERIAVTAGTNCQYALRAVEDLGAVRVRDISLNGIGLLTAKKVDVGATLVIDLQNEAHGFSRVMLLRVAHVTAVNGGFLVGGEFAAPLTYQEFTSLVM